MKIESGGNMLEIEIVNFLTYLKIDKKYSINTCLSYERDLRKLNAFLANPKVTTITPEMLQNYLSSLYDMSSIRSVSHQVSTLKSFFKFLKIEEKIVENPMEFIQNPKLPKSLPQVLCEEEGVQLLDFIIEIKQF